MGCSGGNPINGLKPQGLRIRDRKAQTLNLKPQTLDWDLQVGIRVQGLGCSDCVPGQESPGLGLRVGGVRGGRGMVFVIKPWHPTGMDVQRA